LAWVDTAIVDGSGRVTAVVGVGRDITDRREMEERLRQSEKLEAIGRIAGGVAHDFNNQLTGILNGAEELCRAFAVASDHRMVANTIRDSALRSAALTRQLLAFAHKQPSRTITLDVNRIVLEVVALLSRSIDKRIELRSDLVPGQAAVDGDPDRIHAALLNLALNARDAMPSGGTLSFVTRRAEVDDGRRAELPFDVEPGPYWEVCVRDTGVGLSADARAHLFEPFFTTKGVGKGSGLGLAEVYGTIKAHRGAVTVDSVPSRGTVITLLLPASSSEIEEARGGGSGAAAIQGGHLRILIVDDELNVRRSLGCLLRTYGHDVVECDGRKHSVERHAAEGASYDVAIVDLTMPEIGGREVIGALRHVNPKLPIIVSSGFDSRPVLDALRTEGAVHFMAKPYTANALQAALLAAVPRAA
jgi:signal transduction histidine kinase/ActR/RegA family two-component response regulator